MITTQQWLKKQDELFRACNLEILGRLLDFSQFETAGDGRLGIGMECLDRDLWQLAPTLPEIKRLGIRRARLQTGWAKTERIRGQYDFAWLDEAVDSLAKIGVSCWLSLSYGNPLYAVAGEDGRQDGLDTNPFHSAEGAAAWKRYVQTTVEHYKGRVHIYEIWNEPDVSIFFPINDGPDWMTQYLHMVRETAPVIRRADPTAKIVSVTGCGPTAYGAQRIAKLLEDGLSAYVDVHSFHAYRKQPEAYRRDMQDAFYRLFRRFAPQLEIWRGEAGIASANPKGGKGALHDVKTSEDVQARWLSRHVTRDLADSGLSLTSYFHLYDFEHFTHNYTYHYGVLRDGSCEPKPSYYVLQCMKYLLDDGHVQPDTQGFMDFSGISDLQLQTMAVCVFRRHNWPLFAYWQATDVCRRTPALQAKAHCFAGHSGAAFQNPVLVDPYTGMVAAVPVNAKNGNLSLPIMNHPLFLTEADALEPYLHIRKSDSASDGQLLLAQVDHE